ncbi:hypothetical protein [Wenyingzhuangia sp. IMCC45574]
MKNIYFLLLMFIVFSCDSIDDSLSESEIIELTVYDSSGEEIKEDASIYSDGISNLKLKAIIKGKKDDTHNEVTFTSNLGSFLNLPSTETNKLSIAVNIGASDTIAEAFLQLPLVSTKDDLLFVKASINDFKAEQKIALKPIEISDIVSLEILGPINNAIVVDGTTVVTLKANINPTLNLNDGNITFSASDGTFINTFNTPTTVANQPTTVVVKADNTGIAEATLKLPLDAKTIILKASINNYEINDQIETTVISPLFNFEFVDDNEVPIDINTIAISDDFTILNAKIVSETSIFNSVSFANSDANITFLNSTDKTYRFTDQQAIVRFTIPNEQKNYLISAEVTNGNQTFPILKTISPKTSFAEQIILEPEAILLNDSNNLTTKINTYLRKNNPNAKVSSGEFLKWKAFKLDVDKTEVEVGRFTGESDAKSDANGKISITFIADIGSLEEGDLIFIRATSNNDDSIVKETQLKYKQ